MNERITKTLGIIAGILALFVMFFVVLPTKEVVANHTCPEGQIPIHNPELGQTCLDQDPGEGIENTPSAGQTEEVPEDLGCSLILGGWSGIQQCLAIGGYTIMSFFAALLGLAGILLNSAISLTVQNMAPFVNGNPADTVTGIEVAWKLFRDVGNIIILFVLIFSAVGTILRTDKIVPRGTLAKVIMAAFLINFSLFFTKIIIDVSNVFTSTLHNQIEEIAEQNNDANPDRISLGVAGAFMEGLDPQANLKKMSETLRGTDGGQVAMNILFQSILGSITLLIVTFVFLVMAGMLFIRFVILLILLVTSPIGVVGQLIPKLQKYSSQWWSTLVGQAMFAPVLLLFLLITILLINSGSFVAALNQSNPIPNPEGFVGTILGFVSGGIPTLVQYFIVIGLLITGLSVAKSTAGDFSKDAVGWVSKKAGSLAFGGSAWAGRQALGRAGESLATSATVGRLAAAKNPLYSGLGKGLSLAGNQMKSGSYDFRGTTAGAGLASSLGAGKAGGNGGLTAARKARAEAIQARAEKYAVNRGVSAQEAEIELRQQKLTSAQQAYAAAPLASQTKTDARIAQLKAEKDLETAKDALVEMKGGVRASKAREELTKASQKLSAAQRKDADSHMKVIQIQEELIKTMEERISVNPNDVEAQTKLGQLQTSLANYKATKLSNQPDLEAYIKAQKNYEGVKKAASSISTSEKRTIAEQYMSSMSQARRTAGDELLKGKEKPEDSLTKALKQMMQSGGGGGGGGNQQQNNPPQGGGNTPANTPAPQAAGNTPNQQAPKTP